MGLIKKSLTRIVKQLYINSNMEIVRMSQIDPKRWDEDKDQRKRDKRQKKRKQQKENKRKKRKDKW